MVLRRISGVSDEEMREAICECQAIKKQRQQTVKRLPFERLEMAAQSLGRKLKRSLSGGHQ